MGDSNHTKFNSNDAVIRSTLRVCRRRALRERFLDVLTIAAPAAIGTAVVMQFAELPTLWIFPLAIVSTGGAVWKARLSSGQVAQSLDSFGATGDLFSTASLLCDDGDGDGWNQIIVAQAAQRIEDASATHRWGRTSGQSRMTSVLATGAMIALFSLIQPNSQPRQNANVAASARTFAIHAPVTLASWTAPRPTIAEKSDPHEGGRSIATAADDAPVRQPSDDATGRGRADGSNQVRPLSNDAASNDRQPTGGNHSADGDGNAATSTGDSVAQGGAVASNASQNQTNRLPIDGNAVATTPITRFANSPAVYRPMIEAFFSR